MSATRIGIHTRRLILLLILLSPTACGDAAAPSDPSNVSTSPFVGTWNLFEVYAEPLLFVFSDTRWGCDIDNVNHPGTSFERVRSGLLELKADGSMELAITIERRCVTGDGVDSGWTGHAMVGHGQYSVDGSTLWLDGNQAALLAGRQLHFMAGTHIFMRWMRL